MNIEAGSINQIFQGIPLNDEWCFKNARSVQQWTHGYHKYPAKFLPNLVSKLIEKYSKKDDLIVDVFAGCGTTLVEAKIHGRKSIGVDVNPVAKLITDAKIRPINPNKLKKAYNELFSKVDLFSESIVENIPEHKKIDYWFTNDNKIKIAYLYQCISDVDNKRIRIFFLCALSNILKNCSRWLQSSTKPQIDPDKNIPDPFNTFKVHAKSMVKKNNSFYERLKELGFLNTSCKILLKDARKTGIEDNSVDIIITSPPYVTSYEYADLHQLTGYWYEYFSDIRLFRKRFIGTFYSLNEDINTNSKIAQEIVLKLNNIHKRTAKEVANYFDDLFKVVKESKRILKKGGHICLVIGNTKNKDIPVSSAEVLTELLLQQNLKIVEIIKRSIPYKLIPTIRDNKGRFTKLSNKNSILAYPDEYIIIAKK